MQTHGLAHTVGPVYPIPPHCPQRWAVFVFVGWAEELVLLLDLDEEEEEVDVEEEEVEREVEVEVEVAGRPEG